jgi:hypothetical protein
MLKSFNDAWDEEDDDKENAPENRVARQHRNGNSLRNRVQNHAIEWAKTNLE